MTPVATAAESPVAAQPEEAVFTEAAAPSPGRVKAVQMERLTMLESEDRYLEAIDAVDLLLAKHASTMDSVEVEEFERRRATLDAFVRLAEDTYARAGSAVSRSEEADYLGLIEAFWPSYRDVQERLEELRAITSQEAPDPAEGS